jgi:hypothetical protein
MQYLKIKLEDNKIILVDESAEIKKADWFSCPPRKTYHKCTATFEGNLIDNSWEGRENVEITKSSCFKIIATINHSISLDVPMVVMENEVEKLSNYHIKILYRNTETKQHPIFNDFTLAETSKEDFKEGFKAAQQKGVYSEDDLVSFGKICFYKGFDKSENDDANCFTAWREEAPKLITDLKQEYIELKAEPTEQFDEQTSIGVFKIKTNRVDGQLMAYVKK